MGCAVFDSPSNGATVEENEQDQDEDNIEYFVAFSIESLEGFAILDGGATKTVSGFMSVQPVADRYKGTKIETTDVGFTFAGGDTEAASTNICTPHAEFPQGISVNVVSNESTPFLIGLDVLREYGLVIDYHYNRVHSHTSRSCPMNQPPRDHVQNFVKLKEAIDGEQTELTEATPRHEQLGRGQATATKSARSKMWNAKRRMSNVSFCQSWSISPGSSSQSGNFLDLDAAVDCAWCTIV